MGDHRRPLEIPGIRDSSNGKCILLPEIKQLRQLSGRTEVGQKKVLHGISTRDYKKATEHLAESFGLRSSQACPEFK